MTGKECIQKSPLCSFTPSINYDKELNPEQLKAVTADKGALLVIAGAGSGKTRTVTYRVAHLIDRGVDPTRILLVTFTNKAAKEMLYRVESLIKMETRRLWSGTFHHIGNRILRRHAQVIGYDTNYTILDREDSKDLINNCIAALGFDTSQRRFPKGEVLREIISLSVNTGSTIEDIIRRRYSFYLEDTDEIIRSAELYSSNKRRLNLIDFDDLLLLWKSLLEEYPEIREMYCERFQYILVDEYQDTNKIQADIIDLLASFHGNLMVVGDDAQSIYSFRGANFANIMEFPRYYPDATVFKLETNYRSIPEILHLANSSIIHNKRQFQKKLTAIRTSGPKPAVVPLNDVTQQADFVADRIQDLRDEKHLSFNDISVLYRAHYQCMELQMEFTRRAIPFEVRSGLRFFEQAHIKDVIGFLRIVVNPFDELSWKRVLKLFPDIGKINAHKIWTFVSSSDDPLGAIESREVSSLISKRAMGSLKKFKSILKHVANPSIKDSPADKIRIVMDQLYEGYIQDHFPNFESRIEDINQLGNYSFQYNSTGRFLSELTLLTDLSAEQTGVDADDDEKVILSSIHQAKGLEWRVVFIIWCSDGRFPSSRSLAEPNGEEEERRLFYVAVTRAMDELYICCPQKDSSRNHYMSSFQPSRFINELQQGTYERWDLNSRLGSLYERSFWTVS
ncbi:MAG: ATP-dependent helicase [Thermodesulfobacteriota bacterium]|nr:ATP-dependent helicase [Thermodesulfobacteriota bacterium]